MNDKTKGLAEVSEKLGDIKSDNDIINLLSVAIKYISDRLIEAEEKISGEEQIKIDMLLDKLKNIKGVFLKYGQFFVKNKDEISKILKLREDIVLLKDSTYINSFVIYLTDYFFATQKDLLEVLSYTDSFFTINNFSSEEKNSFGNLLEIIGKSKTKGEKLVTLKNELSTLEGFISRIETRFKKFETLIGDTLKDSQKVKAKIIENFTGSVDDIFGFKFNTGNVAFKFKDNLFLTLFFEELFERIPKGNYGVKTFLEDLFEIGVSKNYSMVKEKSILSHGDYENLAEIFGIYSKLYELHFDLTLEVSNLKGELNQMNSSNVFLSPKNLDDKDEKKLKVFSSGKQRFLHDLRDFRLNFHALIDEIKLKKTSIGDSELLKIKKDIFSKMFEVLEFVSELSKQELVEFKSQLEDVKLDELEKTLSKKKQKDLTKFDKLLKQVFSLLKLKEKFDNSKKDSNDTGIDDVEEGKKSTFHYKPLLDGHGLIERFEEVKTDEIVAKTVGKTADEIREMINKILSRDAYNNILSSFPGNSGSLEGNYIILGPWGGGKTALIKELSQDPRIATVEIGKADIVDMYVGGTEKNVKAIYDLSYQIHQKTRKQVFVFLDEVDAILSKITVSGGGEINVQKEIQTMLDGVHAYPGVHTVMLSNVPHKIPIDIYRRMEKTFILQDLDLSEKIELINTRIDRYPISTDLKEFLDFIKTIFQNTDFILNSGFEQEFIEEAMEKHDFDLVRKLSLKDRDTLVDLYISKKLNITDKKVKNVIKNIYLITPKLLWQVTEKIFKNFISKFQEKDLVNIEKSLSKLKVHSTDKVLKVFSKYNENISLDDFIKALDEVFSSASTKSEIAGNLRFYQTVDEMMRKISSSAFDGVGEDSRPRSSLSIQIIEQ